MPIQSPTTNQLAYATSISWPLESKCEYNFLQRTNWRTPRQSHGLWNRNAITISYNEPIGIRHVNLMAFGFEMPIQYPLTNQLAYATSISWPLDLRCQYNLFLVPCRLFLAAKFAAFLLAPLLPCCVFCCCHCKSGDSSAQNTRNNKSRR